MTPKQAESPGGGRSRESLALTTSGLTLLGVLASVGITVGFGVGGDWWIATLSGVTTTVALTLLAALATSTGRGPLARLANWVIGQRDR